VLTLLLRRAELANDGREVSFLQHRAAEVARTRLNDAKQAIALFEAILEAEPTDARAAQALRELYAETKRDKDLAKLLTRLVDVAESPAERTPLRLELAKLQAEAFDAASDAIETLRAVLDDEPGQADAVVFLSQLYEKTKRDEELADLLSSQIELAKSRGDSAAELAFTVRLGEVLESRLGNAQKAIETYQAVLERDASHAGALEALARLFEKKGEQAKAADVLEKLLALSTGDKAVATAMRLADVYQKLGDDEGIRRSLEKGLDLDVRNADIRKRLAAVYEKTKNWGSLAELLAGDAEAAEGTPAKIALYRKAADLHLSKRGDAAAAATLLEKASALAPDDRELLLLLCDAYSASGRGKDAAEALEKIVASFGGKRSKELAAIHQRLSRAYLAEGNKDKALAELDHAFKIDPGSVAILKDLGTLSMETGDLERAQKTFRALLLQKLDPNGPITKGEVFFYLGDISRRQGDKVKAVQMLERALENESSLDKAKALLSELKK
jgi:tetratricopeptide (TPR) repeat protein